MKEPSQLECLPEDELDSVRASISSLTKTLNKSQLTYIKGMVLPPMFTLNVLKLTYILLNPQAVPENITWMVLKKQMLGNIDSLVRKCECLTNMSFDQDFVEIYQKNCQEVFGNFGNNIQTKAELFGSLVHKLCRLCLQTRVLIHGSKFMRSED